MDKSHSLSVIIPVYNGEATLGKQLDALQDQSYDGEWEIVVVNNRSVDDTVGLIHHYQKKMPQLRLTHAPDKQNKSYTRNQGAQIAKGNVFLFCDADDMVAPGWLAAMASATREHDFVAGAIDYQSINANPSWRDSFDQYPFVPAMRFLPYVVSGNMAVSRRAFEQVGGFSEAYLSSHDIEMSWRLQLQGFEIYYEPKAVMYCRNRESLKGLWKQISTYSYYYPLLYRQYADHGMPRTSRKEVWNRYIWVAKKLRLLAHKSPDVRGKWINRAAYSWGLLKGSIRYRVLYL